MESVNVTEEAVGFPSIEPTAVVDARVAVTEAAANRIAGIVTAASVSGRDLMSRKHVVRECSEFYFEYRVGRGLVKEFDRALAEGRRVLAEEAVDKAARVEMVNSLIKIKEFSRVLAEEVVDEAAYVERAKSLIEKVRTSQFIEEASIAKVNVALSEGLVKFSEAIVAEIPAKLAEFKEASIAKVNAATSEGSVKFFEAIAAEIPAKLAESEAAGAVEMAHAFAGASIYQVIEGGIAKEVDDIETASDATKRVVKKKVVECITAVNRATEAVRIAKATAGEEANLNATRVAAAAIAVAYTQGYVAVAKAAQVEAFGRLRQARFKNNDIEKQVAHEIAKHFTEVVKEYNEEAEEFLVEEEAARAGAASSSSELSKWYETFVRLHKAQPGSEEAVRVAPLPSGILGHCKAFARLYEAQSEIDRDAALKDVAQVFEMFRACIDDMKEHREREVARAAGADDVGPPAVAPA